MSRKVFLSILAILSISLFTGCEKAIPTEANADSAAGSEDSAAQSSADEDLNSGTNSSAAESPAPDTTAAMEAYRKVLQNEAEFYSTEEEKYDYLNGFTYFNGKNYDDLKETRYTAVDMDGDRIPEIVIELTFASTDEKNPFGSEVLHYEDGEVYGYNFGYRSLQTLTLKMDGTFVYANEGDEWGYSKLKFSKDTCQYDNHKEQNGKENAVWQPLADSGQKSGKDSVPSAEKNQKSKTASRSDRSAAMKAYQKVLKNEVKFFSTDENQYIYLVSYKYPGWGDSALKVTHFSVVDMDGGGMPELVLEIDSDRGYEVLHYENRKVYGASFVYRGMEGLKTDGTFTSSGGCADNGYEKLRFVGSKCETEDIGHEESSITDRNGYPTELYYINNKHVTKESYASFDKEQRGKQDAAWQEYTEQNIKKQLSAQ